jgi:choline kinase/protein-L-isoaspartate O-methyltransferase
MPATETKPKCLVNGLGGRAILDWTLEAFRHAGILDIVFVGGYRLDEVKAAYPSLRYVHNVHWADNNVLASLLCAETELAGGFIVSYADTVYRPNVLQRLVASGAPLTIVVDKDWRRRYVGRTDHPESEAEKVIIRDGRVIEIGKHIAPADADGEFTGLASFSSQATATLIRTYHNVATKGEVRFHQAPMLRQAFLTDMLQELIHRGLEVVPIEIWGDWVEIDTPQDLALARSVLGPDGTDGLAREFWAVRARDYAALEWARRDDYLSRIVAAGEFGATDKVLDLGTGTGIVAHAIAPLVAQVVGVDLSHEMLRQAMDGRLQNEVFEDGDARHLHYPDAWFDKVVARMVFHHLMPDPVAAMRECHRVIKPGGLMILSEGVPPDASVKEWYTKMFALKEERLTFLEGDLHELLELGGFAISTSVRLVTPQVSIGNWLRSSGLPEDVQARIHQMHIDLDSEGKRLYNMTVTADDVRCDFAFVIAVGQKVA